jgi:hypothetical protein
LREGQSFLDSNPSAEKEEYDEKRKEIEAYFFNLYLESAIQSLRAEWMLEPLTMMELKNSATKDSDQSNFDSK